MILHTIKYTWMKQAVGTWCCHFVCRRSLEARCQLTINLDEYLRAIVRSCQWPCVQLDGQAAIERLTGRLSCQLVGPGGLWYLSLRYWQCILPCAKIKSGSASRVHHLLIWRSLLDDEAQINTTLIVYWKTLIWINSNEISWLGSLQVKYSFYSLYCV